MKLIGEIIVAERKSRGWTQEHLAELSQLNLRTIQRIENNKNTPRGSTLKMLCAVLSLEYSSFKETDKYPSIIATANKVVVGVFLLLGNLAIMGVFGYLTLDSAANTHSRFAAVLLSFFIPLFITQLTFQLTRLERMLKFGMGMFCYVIMVIVFNSFVNGFVSGLFVCALIHLTILYFGPIVFCKRDSVP